MVTNRPRPGLAALASAALMAGALTLVASPPVHAAPVFVDLDTGIEAEAYARDNAACTESNLVTPPAIDVPLVENGPAVAYSGSASATLDGPAGDQMTAQSSGSVVASLTSAGGNPKSIDADVKGTVSTTSLLATSSCLASAAVRTEVSYTFTVTQAGFLTVHVTRKGPAFTTLQLVQTVTAYSAPYDTLQGQVFDIDQSTRIFLTPGTYEGGFEIGVGLQTRTATPATAGTASVHASFAVAGSQSAAATGKGRGYVALPAARSCATHALTPSVTSRKKRAAKIKQVTFFVNDAKAKKVKHPKRGAVVTLPVVDGVDTELRAVVQLLPKKKGHPGKELEVTSSYVACTS